MNTAQGTEELHCTYMVGSDSGKSIVRKKQGIKFEGETHEGEKANVGDVEGLTPDISRCIIGMIATAGEKDDLVKYLSQ